MIFQLRKIEEFSPTDPQNTSRLKRAIIDDHAVFLLL